MGRRGWGLGASIIAVGAIASIGATGVNAAPDQSPVASKAAKQGKRKRAQLAAARLHPFPSCESVIEYGDAHARKIYGGGYPPQTMPPFWTGNAGSGVTGVAAPTAGSTEKASGTDFSATNVQEQAVDEPDIVKTNGDTVFAIGGSSLHAIDAGTRSPRLLDSLHLPGWDHQLFLDGSRLLVISQKREIPESIEPPPLPDPPAIHSSNAGSDEEPAHDDARTVTVLSEVDVSDPGAMQLVKTEEVDGSFVDARLTGDQARVVITTPPAATIAPSSSLRSPIGGWVPYEKFRNRQTGATTRGPLLDSCDEARHPAKFSGLDMLSVLTIDLSKGLPAVDAEGVMSDGDTVYASADSLYVATQRWEFRGPVRRPSTAIHRFDISQPGSSTYESSGLVRGWLRNQFSMSEYNGFLRVVHTDQAGDDENAQKETFLSVLKQQGNALVQVGGLGNLGRDERVYAVRMMGDSGYVVTFRQVDPLFTLDLSSPSNPRRVGELEIPGYSAYLHPIGNDLLLGVGAAATAEGSRIGTQVSLFDVSDLADPQRLAHATVRGSRTAVEDTHHAFLFWPRTNLALIPVDARMRRHASRRFVGAIGFTVDKHSIGRVGKVIHEGIPFDEIQRSLVVGGRVFTLSCTGIEVADMAHLRQLAWTPFPDDPEVCEPPPAFSD